MSALIHTDLSPRPLTKEGGSPYETHHTANGNDGRDRVGGKRGGLGHNQDLELPLKADRSSCHRFIANQFRLLLHAAAYWLVDALRRRLIGAGIKRGCNRAAWGHLSSTSEGGSVSTLGKSARTWLWGIPDNVHVTLFRWLSEVLMT